VRSVALWVGKTTKMARLMAPTVICQLPSWVLFLHEGELTDGTRAIVLMKFPGMPLTPAEESSDFVYAESRKELVSLLRSALGKGGRKLPAYRSVVVAGPTDRSEGPRSFMQVGLVSLVGDERQKLLRAIRLGCITLPSELSRAVQWRH
jgi:hypothetical protein